MGAVYLNLTFSADHILAYNQPALSPTSFYIVAIRLPPFGSERLHEHRLRFGMLGNDFRTFEYFQ